MPERSCCHTAQPAPLLRDVHCRMLPLPQVKVVVASGGRFRHPGLVRGSGGSRSGGGASATAADPGSWHYEGGETRLVRRLGCILGCMGPAMRGARSSPLSRATPTRSQHRALTGAAAPADLPARKLHPGGAACCVGHQAAASRLPASPSREPQPLHSCDGAAGSWHGCQQRRHWWGTGSNRPACSGCRSTSDRACRHAPELRSRVGADQPAGGRSGGAGGGGRLSSSGAQGAPRAPAAGAAAATAADKAALCRASPSDSCIPARPAA